MGVADTIFEPRPPDFGKILIFWRCSNDSKTIFWYFQRYKKCQKSVQAVHAVWFYKKHCKISTSPCFLFFPILQIVLFLNRFLIFLKKWAEIADLKETKTFLPQKYVFVIIIWCTNMFFVHSSIIQYWFFPKNTKNNLS